MEGLASFRLPGPDAVSINLRFPLPDGEKTCVRDLGEFANRALSKFLSGAVLTFGFVPLPPAPAPEAKAEEPKVEEVKAEEPKVEEEKK